MNESKPAGRGVIRMTSGFLTGLVAGDTVRVIGSKIPEGTEIHSAVFDHSKQVVEVDVSHPSFKGTIISPEDLGNVHVERLDRHPNWTDSAEAILQAINELRAEEAASVLIPCQNPDFNGLPNEAVTVCGSWTDWEDRLYQADTLGQALANALADKRKADVAG